jgi:hypothetical protein
MFFSTIRPCLKRHLIQRSLLFACPGFFLIFYMGVFLPVSSLERWGIWGFISAFILISCGMIPYRRITRLELHPHSLSLGREGFYFHHTRKGEKFFSFQEIQTAYFIQKKGFYGIRLHLKEKKSFLLPYFSETTFEALETIWK